MSTEIKKPSNPRMQLFDGMYASDAYKENDFITLRDEVAKSVLNGIISSNTEGMANGMALTKENIKSFVEVSFLFADEFLKQRENE